MVGMVNVAQVPQRSPFRYPGGKTWAVPTVRRWLASLPARPALFVEPFAGGGIISLTVAAEDFADHVLMVELDEDVAAVWSTLIDGAAYGDAEWLARRIAEFILTPANVAMVLAATPTTVREHAFQTILRNRVQHGGKMARGAGLLKHGENGKGLGSRWYAGTLATRIRAIARMSNRLTFTAGDGLAVMREHADRSDVAFFLDPPYTAGGKRAGRRLYAHSEIDHAELFRLASAARGDVLMTYDDAPELHELAFWHGFQTVLLPMKTTHHTETAELLIGKDLSWME